MDCYNHSNVSAVGICKSCGRALCHDCIVEVEDGLACKSKCEAKVEIINKILNSNSKILGATKNRVKTAAISGIILGIGFCIFGIWSYFELRDSFLPYFLGSIGIVIFISSVLNFSRSHKYPNINNS